MIFAKAFAEGEAAANPMAGTVMSVGWIVLLLILMYFMLFRPQRKQQKEQQKMLSSLAVGDKVVTIGGICGKIAKIKDEKVWITTGKLTDDAEKSCLTFERNAIKSVEKKIEE